MRESLFSRFSDLKEPVHGGTPLADDVIDFSISVNPFPLPESVGAAYKKAWSGVGLYPDTGSGRLKSAIAGRYGLREDQLLVTNGSAEAFSLIAALFLNGGDGKVLVISPGYSDYEHVSRAAGAEITVHQLAPENRFAVDERRLLKDAMRVMPDLIWLCSPNNPTGGLIDSGLLNTLLTASREWGGFVVLDEAYASFVSREQQPEPDPGNSLNLVRVRSMTKDFSIPGLRLGWVSASSEVIRMLNIQRPCWNVNYPAQQVGISLFEEFEYFEECWTRISGYRDELVSELKLLGIDVVGAPGNYCGIFIFFRAPVLPAGRDFGTMLEARGIRLRDCGSMGAPGYYRAGVKLPEDNIKLIRAVESVMKEEGGRYGN